MILTYVLFKGISPMKFSIDDEPSCLLYNLNVYLFCLTAYEYISLKFFSIKFYEDE